MGRGYFPLYESSDRAKQLREAIQKIEAVRDELINCVYSGDDGQFDNAASDGGYLERLSIAVEMLDGCIERKRETPKGE